MHDPQAVADALASRPALSTLSDSDAAAALNVPDRAIKTVVVDIGYIAGVLGNVRADQILETLKGIDDPNARLAVVVLCGQGKPAAKIVGTAGLLVAAGIATAAEADALLYDLSYPLGTPDVTAADVTTARRLAAFDGGHATLNNEKIGPALSAIESLFADRRALLLSGQGAELPTPTELSDLFRSAVGG